MDPAQWNGGDPSVSLDIYCIPSTPLPKILDQTSWPVILLLATHTKRNSPPLPTSVSKQCWQPPESIYYSTRAGLGSVSPTPVDPLFFVSDPCFLTEAAPYLPNCPVHGLLDVSSSLRPAYRHSSKVLKSTSVIYWCQQFHFTGTGELSNPVKI